MILLNESGRKRDGRRWRAKVRSGSRSGLRDGIIYEGLGRDFVPGYVWLEDDKWARCVSEAELEPVTDAP
jgi:hypothetical protein